MQMVFYCIYIQIGSYIIIKFFNSASKWKIKSTNNEIYDYQQQQRPRCVTVRFAFDVVV